MSSSNEVYFCGHCHRQQQPSQGEKCIQCGKQTVSWDTSRESSDQAQKKWDRVFGS